VTEDISNLWIWIRVKLKTLSAARGALKLGAIDRHREAMVEPDKTRRSDLRAEGDYLEGEERELQHAQMDGLREAGKKEPHE